MEGTPSSNFILLDPEVLAKFDESVSQSVTPVSWPFCHFPFWGEGSPYLFFKHFISYISERTQGLQNFVIYLQCLFINFFGFSTQITWQAATLLRPGSKLLPNWGQDTNYLYILLLLLLLSIARPDLRCGQYFLFFFKEFFTNLSKVHLTFLPTHIPETERFTFHQLKQNTTGTVPIKTDKGCVNWLLYSTAKVQFCLANLW